VGWVEACVARVQFSVRYREEGTSAESKKCENAVGEGTEEEVNNAQNNQNGVTRGGLGPSWYD